MSKLKKIVILLAVLVICIPASVFGYIYFKLNSIHDPNANNNLLDNINYKSEKGLSNILLVGTDGRTVDEVSRSDSMMILTVDGKNKSIKLTSLARDSYVDIPGRGKQKLTHAYVYGGIDLLIETIENNFKIDIKDYVIVNFFSFMDIIDALNGVEVEVKESELKELNKYIEKNYNLNNNPNKGELEYIETAGTHRLNGYQALSFSRIRKNDSAFERDRRQREVIEALIISLKELPITKYPNLIDTVLPYVKTNMSLSRILGLGAQVLGFGNFNIKQLEFPIDNSDIIVMGKS